MKTYIESSVLVQINEEKPAFQFMQKVNNLLNKEEKLKFCLSWPAFLKYVGISNILEKFPNFAEGNQILEIIKKILLTNPEKDLLHRLYDQVFVECLTHVKALPQVNASFIIAHIDKKRQSSSPLPFDEAFFLKLDHYKNNFLHNTSRTMHDLILYLAWDRVCTNMAFIFEFAPSQDILPSLNILKECLIESFHHITLQGRTAPGFFRFLEALYAYQMREELLQTHTDEEWLILCQSSQILQPRELLVDVPYIDAVIVNKGIDDTKNGIKPEGGGIKAEGDDITPERNIDKSNLLNHIQIVTLQSKDKVNISLSLAEYMFKKLKKEVPGWQLDFLPPKIIYLD